MTKQSMGALVKYLEERGYVRVDPDPNDRRANIVHRIKKGIDSEPAARRNVVRVMERWGRMLGPGEMEELVRLLRKLNDRLTEEQTRSGPGS